ncbi:MAG: DUF559 domain-containing protein [Gammaproteobacteria bacterium]|nr:DUF559 domain-containing protein [Gammaproteobacteria bacterium]
MIIESGDGRTSSKVTNKFHSLHKSVSKLLPCWAVTSLSARGKLPFISGYYDLVVIDEASQCDIASALPLLYRAKSAVIIGDRQQLSHISRIQKRQDQQLLERFGLVDHFLHWAYATNSLFEMTHSFAKSDDTVNLRDHHRSHADIINFSNKYFYEGYLRIATNYERLKMPKFGHRKTPAVRWIDVKGQTIRPTNGSAINPQEATTVIDELIRLFLEQGYQGTVGVVSPFRAQANLIRERFAKNDDLYNLMDQSEFLSDTVHRFQGDERDIMVFSPVISKGAQEQTISFLRSERNLFNVAITRARASLVVVGDLGTTKQCGVDYLEKFASYVEELEERTKEKTDTSHFSEFGPRYPQSIDRARVSDWEIILYEALYGEGIRTFPQYPVEQYKLDLAVVKGARQLDIEVDGERYHKDWTGELCRKDQIRNQRLYELGWDVLRFWVYEVRDDLDNCVNRVKCWVEKVHDSSNLPP